MQKDKIRQETDICNQHKANADANNDTEYEVEEHVMKKVQLDPGTYVTNCLSCNRTCHFPCANGTLCHSQCRWKIRMCCHEKSVLKNACEQPIQVCNIKYTFAFTLCNTGFYFIFWEKGLKGTNLFQNSLEFVFFFSA